MAGNDMTVPCEDGLINLRVGAIILKNGKISRIPLPNGKAFIRVDFLNNS
jgi:hypothetical protein